jgi:hypothetical protein
MINIDRPTQGPTALDRPEIQNYLEALQQYWDAERAGESAPKPTPPGTYRDSDLLKMFETIFHTKCWLTEKKFAAGGDLEVDHFVPKSQAEHLRYQWTNLLPIDATANKIRPKLIPEGGYLDPCDPADDVEKEILYFLMPDQGEIVFEATDPGNAKARNTAALLHRVHNGHDHATIVSTEGLRKLIFKRENEILRTYLRYTQEPEGSFEKRVAQAELRHYFSRKAAFTMLMRCSDTGHRLQHFHQD